MFRAAFLGLLLFGLTEAGPEPFPLKVAKGGLNEGQRSSPYMVKLDRVQGPRLLHGAAKSFYVANLHVGGPTPQELRVVFDLASGQVVFPSTLCTGEGCVRHRRYNEDISLTASDIQANGKLVQDGVRKVTRLLKRDRATINLNVGELGSGDLKGILVREKVCFDTIDNHRKCVEMGIVAAKEMADEPFRALPHDGFVGLGLEGLSISREFNFFRSLVAQSPGLPHQFGFYLGRGNEGGEIAFGGYNEKRAAFPIMWVPVANPEDGLWQVSIHAIRVGGSTLDACNGREFGCRGAVDAAAAHLSVPQLMAEGLQNALVVAPPAGHMGDGCGDALGLDLQLVLEGTTLTLPAHDYAAGARRSADAGTCAPTLAHHTHPAALGQGLFLLGESILRRYYTVYDWDLMRIGFSLVNPEEEIKKVTTPLLGTTSADPKPDAPPIFLLQLKFRPALKKVARLM